MSDRLLIACVGNIFLGDDGFGTAVAEELTGRELPAGARLHDYGIGSIHLVYDLLDGYDVLLLVDTVGRQEGPAGSLYVIEPDRGSGPAEPVLDPHDLPPGGALELIGSLGGQVARIVVVGVQPADLTEGIGLSAAVRAAVVPAAELVLDVARRELARLAAPEQPERPERIERIGEGVST